MVVIPKFFQLFWQEKVIHEWKRHEFISGQIICHHEIVSACDTPFDYFALIAEYGRNKVILPKLNVADFNFPAIFPFAGMFCK